MLIVPGLTLGDTIIIGGELEGRNIVGGANVVGNGQLCPNAKVP